VKHQLIRMGLGTLIAWALCAASLAAMPVSYTVDATQSYLVYSGVLFGPSFGFGSGSGALVPSAAGAEYNTYSGVITADLNAGVLTFGVGSGTIAANPHPLAPFSPSGSGSDSYGFTAEWATPLGTRAVAIRDLEVTFYSGTVSDGAVPSLLAMNVSGHADSDLHGLTPAIQALFTPWDIGNGDLKYNTTSTAASLTTSGGIETLVIPVHYFDDEGGDKTTILDGQIVATRVVPEPTGLILAVCASIALAVSRQRSDLRRPTSLLRAFLALSFSLVATIVTPALAVTISTVPVGDPGNAGDVQSQGTFGAVGYNYRIGTTEVTNAQYVEFLNAKAASDPLGLYNTNMGDVARGGIMRSGVAGSYSYGVKTNMGDKPVNYVSFFDAIRFANWLNNGQGGGDTETGAYTLTGGVPTPFNGTAITRNLGATWFVPSEDEWYKAAYYQPAAQGGDTDNYWLYPTASNTAPTIATADSAGDISNPGANTANYLSGASWNSQDGNVTTVGSAGPLSTSYYGTSDQGGNVWEWNERNFGAGRGLRGGSWDLDAPFPDSLAASSRRALNPVFEVNTIGFRVATVPEPGTAVLAVLGMIGLFGWSASGKRLDVTRRRPPVRRQTPQCMQTSAL
jgi:formylglycine-generating enzyme